MLAIFKTHNHRTVRPDANISRACTWVIVGAIWCDVNWPGIKHSITKKAGFPIGVHEIKQSTPQFISKFIGKATLPFVTLKGRIVDDASMVSWNAIFGGVGQKGPQNTTIP
jgi:hypothetical protein